VALYTSSDGTEADVTIVAEALMAAGAHGVIWGVDDGVADVARGVVQRTWGSATIEEHLTTASGRTVSYRLSATSFFQTNTAGAQLLYDTVGEALIGSGTLLDLYCGTGAIGLFLADRFSAVVGVEVIEAAVRDAEENAVRNGVEASYRVARVEDALDCLEIDGPVSAVVDPPRAGLHPKVAKALATWKGAEELIYVACGPAALGRDAAVLEEGGWRLTDLWTVDMFPQTGHVEMVARFVR
jgi:23S rRNA (uracil1939-C5)-methyltransferase